VSKAHLVITAVVVEGRSQSEVARAYSVSQGWISRLVARFRREGEAAFEPRSRRPNRTPTAIPRATVDLICQLRHDLTSQGLDGGPETIAWHLAQHHGIAVSIASVSRYLRRAGLVTPDPAKRPRSSYIRFQADLPNECWQADFTHYRLTRYDGRPGPEVEILSNDHGQADQGRPGVQAAGRGQRHRARRRRWGGGRGGSLRWSRRVADHPLWPGRRASEHAAGGPEARAAAAAAGLAPWSTPPPPSWRPSPARWSSTSSRCIRRGARVPGPGSFPGPGRQRLGAQRS